MKTNYLPNQLPFLPGNTYADPTINRYHKTQLLGIKDGTITGKCKLPAQPPFIICPSFYNLFFEIIEKTVNLQENVNPDLIASMTQSVPSYLFNQ